MATSTTQSLSAFVARQPKFHFWLLSSLGVVVFASSFLSHDKRGLLYYDEPSALLADDLALMPEYVTGGFGSRLANGPYGGGERPAGFRRAIGPRDPGFAGAPSAAPGGAIAPAGTPVPASLAEGPGPALASGPATGGSPLGLPAFGDGGFAPTPIGFVPAGDGGSSGGSSSGGGGSTSGGTSSTSGGSSSGGGTPDPVVPAVPEPASWLMMIIAVFTLGSAIRRGHEDRAPVAAF
ncbi:hypothetical protein [Aurantiacibacter suaedae]|uniref:hypothetical protein n=1 Tax=Aurantiacibacter suaedae TaxID=2545755 RepID=UPI0010F85EDD|nr:hypothetical protein [Aurantiacibacter suaedae]